MKEIMRSPRCYLDKRRRCFHSKESKMCQNNMMICEEMKPIRGEFHKYLRYGKWKRKHVVILTPEDVDDWLGGEK